MGPPAPDRSSSRGGAKATRGVYAPDEYLNAIERLDTSRGKSAVSRGRGFDQPYAQDAREVLGGKPAKKSSVQTTAVTGYLLGQLGPAALPLLGAAAGGYTPGVKRLVQFMVEGGMGKTPAAVEEALGKSELGRKILSATDADTRRQLLTQILRGYASE